MTEPRRLISLVIVLCTTLGCLLLSSCGMGENANKSQVEFEYFKSDIFDILIGKETNVFFTAKLLFNQPMQKTGDVFVTDSSAKQITVLRDDGKAGDETAGDGIYSSSVALMSDKAKNESYAAQFGNAKSDSIGICFYRIIAKEEMQSVVNLSDALNQIKYSSDSIETRLNQVEEYLNKSEIVSSIKTDIDTKSVYFITDFGIRCVHTVAKDPALLGSGSRQITTPTAEKSSHGSTMFLSSVSSDLKGKDILLCSPYQSESDEEIKLPNDVYKAVMSSVTDKTGSTSQIVADNDVTLEFMTQLSDYAVVFLNTHGGLWWGDSGDPYIMTGASNWAINAWTQIAPSISADFLYGRIVYETSGRAGITNKFFDKYYRDGSFEDTLIWIGACYGLNNSTLADVFIKKGASCVYGYSESVLIKDDSIIFSFCFACLLGGYTSKESYELAKLIAKNEYPESTFSLMYYDDGDKYKIINTNPEEPFNIAKEKLLNGEYESQTTTKVADKDTLLSLLKSKTADDVVEFIYDDFDANGTFEAFGITAKEKLVPEDKYNGAQVWYVDSNDAKVIKSGMRDPGYLDTMIVINNKKFLCWLDNATNYGTYTQIFGVNNGKPFISKLSGKYNGIIEQDGNYFAFIWDHDSGALGSKEYKLSLSETNDLHVVNSDNLASTTAGITVNESGTTTGRHQTVAKAGDVVLFGSYEQDNNIDNGKEPIQWRVIAIENGKALLLSEKILDSKPYNIEPTEVTWETCTLRKWLNNEFFNAAFNTNEKAKIRTTKLINKNNPKYGISGGNDTQDKVFLLSYGEVTNPDYGFKAASKRADDHARPSQGTAYAISNGLYVNHYSSVSENSDWWLRTPGDKLFKASHVSSNGNGCSLVSLQGFGVCPAIWIDL